ncbi:DUF5686 and carboxypeptidase regulatory-like domain-containing protein [Halosquirtibacter xylanolyticus]|uniref:DUF5686 and carboxypeptidase-like regulatory domain-containing protein n=1 Tax=Halosquirtibacter xylanolyticus TaxID=3374599 RepID=UPI0037488127|nr:DUF5686 and carboxypeptidase regulatory-like domain-containing protein [Prolixibacteraceae bacterium]
MLNKLLSLLLGFILLSSLEAEAEKVTGIVYDYKTKEPIPYVQVKVAETYIGTVTSDEGYFEIEVPKLPVTIEIKYIGYKSLTLDIKETKNSVSVYLQEESLKLDEITVTPNTSYDQFLLKQIVKNRKHNNPDLLNNIHYRDYTRMSVFVGNIDKRKISSSRIFKNQTEAMIPTSDTTVMMPFFIEESITDHFRSQHNDSVNHVLNRSDGVMNEIKDQVRGVLNKRLTADINLYNNQIEVFQRGFPSPISRMSSIYYNVYVTDSIANGNTKLYKFGFYPKSKKNTTFSGYFWVDSKSWALTEVRAKLPNSANINFVSNFSIAIDYKQNKNGKWFYDQQKMKLHFSLSKQGKDLTGKPFLIQRINTFQEIQQVKTHIQSKEIQQVKTHIQSKEIQQLEQDSILHLVRKQTPMDQFEMSADKGIKILKNNWFIKNVDRFSAMTLNGYYNLNKIDLGPYFSFYNKNEIEGSRVTLPFRTSRKMFDNFTVGGYLGYGFKNKEFAYGGNIGYQFKTPHRSIISSKYHYDYFNLTRNKFIEFIQENPYQKGGGNIISSYTSFEPNPYMLRNQHGDLTYEYELNKSIGFLWRGSLDRYYSNRNVPFITDGKSISNFNTQSILFDTRLSFDQDYDDVFFSRIYYGNNKPIIHLGLLFGHYNINSITNPKSGYYANWNVSVKNRVNIGPTFLKSFVEFGGIIGDVPYPLLNMAKGSRDLGSARYHYNLLHHTSYISDLYFNLHLAYNTGGILFNKIPLIKDFNLREIFTFKTYYGTLRDGHNKVMNIPNFFNTNAPQPYMEASAGITNIFKCLRIEYVYRLNNAESFNSFSDKSGIRFRIEVTF